MTKYYEEYLRVNIDELTPFTSDPKGELTIIISQKIKDKNLSISLTFGRPSNQLGYFNF